MISCPFKRLSSLDLDSCVLCFPGTFSQGLRSAKSKVVIANGKAFAEVFSDTVKDSAGSEDARDRPMKTIGRFLESRLSDIPEVRRQRLGLVCLSVGVSGRSSASKCSGWQYLL